MLSVFFRAEAATIPVGNLNDAGPLSLRQAIIDANASFGADVIDATGINGVINLLSVLPIITESVTINGPGMLALTINQTIDRRVFTTDITAINFALNDLTLNFTGPGAVPYAGGGGAILTGGTNATTTLFNVKISNFRYQIGNGGAISQSFSTLAHNLTLINCVFQNNRCGGAGGAVAYNGLGTVNITGCQFMNNETGPVGANTGGDGGALVTTGSGNGGTYLVEKNTFTGNSVLNTTGHAAAVMNVNGALTVRYNRFVGNFCANVANPPLANIVAQTGGSTINTTVADNNWWGVNTGPGANDATALAAGGTLTLSKWLQLKTTASPNPICAANPSSLGNTSTVTASFLSNSANEAIAATNLTVLSGLTVSWGPTTLGSLSGSQTSVQSSGTATSTFTSNGTGGNATVNAVVDNVPNTDATARATIAVYTSPTVSDPSNQVGCVGGNASFTVNISGGVPAPTIQWYKGATMLVDGVKYTGATTNTLTINNAQLSDVAANYYVVVSNPCGSDQSENASLSLNNPSVAPTGISGNISFCDPGSTTLTATGGTLGTGANYQWGTGAVVGTNPLNGETNVSLNVSPATSTTYWVRIENTTAPCPSNTGGVTQLVTVLQPSVAPTGVAGNTSICPGGSTMLTVNGGTMGTDAVVEWFTGSCGGTFYSNGNSIMVSPSSTTTYYVRYKGFCNTTACAMVTVTVKTLSTAPTGITGTMSICAGGSTTLNVQGGSAGTGAVAEWFTGSCGGTPAGSGNSITVSPGATTTYYVRYSGDCNTTSCAQATVTVKSPSTMPTGITGTTTICSGSSTSLTVSGGSPGTGAITEWFSGSCGGTPEGTGNSITVSPASTTTYYVRYAGDCNTTSCAMTTIIVNTAPIVTLDPQSQSVVPPGIATFTAAASGIPSPSVQWQVSTGGAFGDIPGANSTTLSFATTSADNGNQYRAVFTNICGSATSTAATLTTCTPPIIFGPSVVSLQNTTGQCGTIINYVTSVSGTPAPVITYTFSGATTGSGSGTGSGSFFYVGTTVVVLTATNACGTSSWQITMVVFDREAPTVTTGNIGSCYKTAAEAEAAAIAATSATDNCPGTITKTAATVGDCSAVITVTVTDAHNNTATATYYTRIDNTAPVVTKGSIAGCYTSIAEAEAAALAATSATDNCDGTLTETASTTGTCNAVIIVTTTDGCGNASQVTYNTRIDNTGPTISGLSVSQASLWPANHKMQTITVSYTATDNCSGNVNVSLEVTSNEPINGTGDGDMDPDWEIVDGTHVRLRAERAGNGSGRIYTITVKATDACGNQSSATTTVVVAHNITAPISGRAVKVGSTVSFAGTFWDVPGNRHTARWVIDGTTVSGKINTEPNGLNNGTATGSYKFNSAGVYKLRMEITDQLGNTSYADVNNDLDAIVVVYDPNGGNTFGGGSFVSQPGAIPGNTKAAGLVSYGFQNNYFKTATNPKGETQLEFKVGEFEFNALNYDYLVVDKYKAQFKGYGRITGGQSGIAFIMTVIDGEVAGGGGVDKLRMKIFNKNTDEVYYDNQPGASDADDPVWAVTKGSTVVIDGTDKSGTEGGGGGKGKPNISASQPAFLDIRVSNNPATGQNNFALTVVSNDKQTPIRLRITDGTGRVVNSYNNLATGTTLQLGNRWTGGMYFAEATQNGKRIVVKLLKQ